MSVLLFVFVSRDRVMVFKHSSQASISFALLFGEWVNASYYFVVFNVYMPMETVPFYCMNDWQRRKNAAEEWAKKGYGVSFYLMRCGDDMMWIIWAFLFLPFLCACECVGMIELDVLLLYHASESLGWWRALQIVSTSLTDTQLYKPSTSAHDSHSVLARSSNTITIPTGYI